MCPKKLHVNYLSLILTVPSYSKKFQNENQLEFLFPRFFMVPQKIL